MKREIPRYLEIYYSLKQQIENRDYKAGDFLSPEPELEKQYAVSRTTIRKAVELLERQGFVDIRQGRGTRVLDFKATQKLYYVTSFSETLTEQGFTVDHRLLSLEIDLPTARIATDLDIATSDRVVRIERLALANGKPVAVMVNYLIADIVPGIEKRKDRIKSLYIFLEQDYAIRIDAATDFIGADLATEKEAALLSVLPHAPILTVKRISYRASKPVELANLRIVADRYEYSVHTKERPPQASRNIG